MLFQWVLKLCDLLNLKGLWADDRYDYRKELRETIETLANAKIPVQCELEDELTPNFSILKSRKSYVGPKDGLHVNVKILAKKNYA